MTSRAGPSPSSPPSRYWVPDRARRIDAACDRFEADWRAGRGPRIEDSLAAAVDVANDDAGRGEGEGPPIRDDLLRELMQLEIELAGEIGRIPSRAEWRARFPADDPMIDAAFGRAEGRGAAGGGGDEPGHPQDVDPGGLSLSPGDRIGRYAVLGRLDEGGEALVYRVLHVGLGKPYVLKLGRRPLDGTTSAAEGDALAAQGRLLAALDHPGLVPVVDLDMHQGRPCLVMESVPGLDLARYAEQHRPTPRRSAAIVAEAARVVAYLHGRGIIHQDIKPRNILIDESGRPRIIDFGQARLRHAWSSPGAEAEPSGGTPAYMAPEQAAGDPGRITARTDVFGLGAVLYELLCGRPPYRGPTLTALAAQAREGRVVPPRQVDRRIPRGLEAICLRAMARDPSDRYAGAVEMSRALRRYLRRPLLIAAAAALLVPAVLAVARGAVTR